MDEMEGKDAFSFPPKTNDGNIEDEMEKEHKMEEMNGCESGAIGIEIASSKTMIARDKQEFFILGGSKNEQFAREFHMCVGGEEEKEIMKRDMNNEKSGEIKVELTSFDSMNGEESICTLGGKEKDNLAKETNVVIAHEEEKELPMEEFNYEEDPNEESTIVEGEKEEVKNEGEEDEKEEVDIDEEDPDEELIYVENENEEVENKEGEMEEVNNEENEMEEVKNKEVRSEEDEMEEVKNEEDEVEEVKNEENEMEEIKNEAQVEVISKKKIARLKKKWKAMNHIATDTNYQEPSNKNLQLMELNNKEKINDEVVHEKDVNGEVKNDELMEDTSQKKLGKLRKNGRKGSKKKMAVKGMNEVIIKDTNAKEPSNKKAKANANVTGMIFMCSSKTKNDCYHYKVLGLPANKRDIVLKIHEGMKLFLFDFDLKLLYGIYKATSPGGYNIEPKAFKSAFPSQVRFSVHEDCLPLPEEKFKKVIKDNYYQKNKFDCQLTSEKVKNLCKLFQAASTKSKALRKNPEAQIRTFTDRDRSTKRHYRAETQTVADHDRSKKWRHRAGAQTVADHDRTRRRRGRAETRTFADQDRTKKRRHGAETHTSADQDRARKRRPIEETHIFPDRERMRSHRDAYERETYASPVAPLPSRPPLPTSSALAFHPRSYAYEGGLEMNVYRGDPLVEHQDIQYRDLELGHRDHIEQARVSFHEHHDRRFADSELRHNGEIERRDPYALYRDGLRYDLPYSVAQPSEYHSRLRTSLHPLAPLQRTSLYDRYDSTRSWY